jgi:hypothetical protein
MSELYAASEPEGNTGNPASLVPVPTVPTAPENSGDGTNNTPAYEVHTPLYEPLVALCETPEKGIDIHNLRETDRLPFSLAVHELVLGRARQASATTRALTIPAESYKSRMKAYQEDLARRPAQRESAQRKHLASLYTIKNFDAFPEAKLVMQLQVELEDQGNDKAVDILFDVLAVYDIAYHAVLAAIHNNNVRRRVQGQE